MSFQGDGEVQRYKTTSHKERHEMPPTHRKNLSTTMQEVQQNRPDRLTVSELKDMIFTPGFTGTGALALFPAI